MTEDTDAPCELSLEPLCSLHFLFQDFRFALDCDQPLLFFIKALLLSFVIFKEVFNCFTGCGVKLISQGIALLKELEHLCLEILAHFYKRAGCVRVPLSLLNYLLHRLQATCFFNSVDDLPDSFWVVLLLGL